MNHTYFASAITHKNSKKQYMKNKKYNKKMNMNGLPICSRHYFVDMFSLKSRVKDLVHPRLQVHPSFLWPQARQWAVFKWLQNSSGVKERSDKHIG